MFAAPIQCDCNPLSLAFRPGFAEPPVFNIMRGNAAHSQATSPCCRDVLSYVLDIFIRILHITNYANILSASRMRNNFTSIFSLTDIAI